MTSRVPIQALFIKLKVFHKKALCLKLVHPIQLMLSSCRSRHQHFINSFTNFIQLLDWSADFFRGAFASDCWDKEIYLTIIQFDLCFYFFYSIHHFTGRKIAALFATTVSEKNLSLKKRIRSFISGKTNFQLPYVFFCVELTTWRAWREASFPQKSSPGFSS